MYSLYFFSMLLHGGPPGMPARALLPALFLAGLVIQTALSRRGGKRSRRIPVIVLAVVIVLCETVGRLADNGLTEIIIVACAWSALLGVLAALALHILRSGGHADA
ncbi:MAG: hypothetical protein II094_02060 [Oscillospiraceae bacterium]|nr:hypothetical protein [Oscillospiraceae bacterium]MBQ5443533.1 hypothetical protein [Oscillospiraceae bacterium]